MTATSNLAMRQGRAHQIARPVNMTYAPSKIIAHQMPPRASHTTLAAVKELLRSPRGSPSRALTANCARYSANVTGTSNARLANCTKAPSVPGKLMRPVTFAAIAATTYSVAIPRGDHTYEEPLC